METIETIEESEKLQEMHEYGNSIDTSTLPRDGVYDIVINGPAYTIDLPIVEGINGYYHALFVRQKISDEYGFAGISISVQEAE